MIAKLKEYSDGTYYCSNCRMRQTLDEAYCCYCGCEFSNYEEVQHKLWLMLNKELELM